MKEVTFFSLQACLTEAIVEASCGFPPWLTGKWGGNEGVLDEWKKFQSSFYCATPQKRQQLDKLLAQLEKLVAGDEV